MRVLFSVLGSKVTNCWGYRVWGLDLGFLSVGFDFC
jgi:hypothetical protein